MSAKKSAPQLLICNCQKTMPLDEDGLREALLKGGTTAAGEAAAHAPVTLQRELCRSGIAAFKDALARAGADGLQIACTQEAPLFREVTDEFQIEGDAGDASDMGKMGEMGSAEQGQDGDVPLLFTNIRERAGWCQPADAATQSRADAARAQTNLHAKVAALLTEGRYQAKPASAMTLQSDGVCLVYGKGQAAFDVAQKLARNLSVSLLLSDAADVMPPATVDVPIYRGRIKSATGHLGAFDVVVDDYAPMLPSSKSALDFAMPRDGATSTCDLIFDMSGGTKLFSSAHGVDGYFHVDPGHRAGIAEALFEVSDMVGEFEKPLYVSYDSSLCAHARSGQIGCSNCIDNCPTGAIRPDGDHIAVDPGICGGCGNCSAVCPTGAVSYSYPNRQDVIARAQLLLKTYGAAGGHAPSLLLHDESHGSALVSAMARFGRGLPPNLLPMSLYSVYQLGHEALTAMLTSGAAHIVVLANPEKSADLPAIERETALSNALLAGLGAPSARVHLLNESDPDVVEAALHDLPAIDIGEPQIIEPVGSKRDIARNALAKLHAASASAPDVIALPEGAPYGRIEIETQGCTLCLACVGACPADALDDHPDHPEVSFTEAACVQCGLCATTCPEKVITLQPRYNFAAKALEADVLNMEEPFPCIECGKPFGTKSMVEKVVERLQGHAMFQNDDQIRMIQMCEDCRVVTLANSKDDPFRRGEVPKVRTTQDYLDAEEPAKGRDKKPDEFLG